MSADKLHELIAKVRAKKTLDSVGGVFRCGLCGRQCSGRLEWVRTVAADHKCDTLKLAAALEVLVRAAQDEIACPYMPQDGDAIQDLLNQAADATETNAVF